MTWLPLVRRRRHRDGAAACGRDSGHGHNECHQEEGRPIASRFMWSLQSRKEEANALRWAAEHDVNEQIRGEAD